MNYIAFLYKTSNQPIIELINQLFVIFEFDSGKVVRSMTWFQTSHYDQFVNNNYIRIHFKSWLNRLKWFR